MSRHKSLIQGLGCAVISAINKDGLINASSGFAGIESAVISIIAIPRSINAGCSVVAICGAGVAIITDYPGRYILSITLRFVTGNILFNVTNEGFDLVPISRALNSYVNIFNIYGRFWTNSSSI
jgi:hypothetical protein